MYYAAFLIATVLLLVLHVLTKDRRHKLSVKPLIYLASPYTAKNEDGTPDKKLMHERYRAAAKQTAIMLKAGRHTFSPIVHSHPLADDFGLPTSWEFWQVVDRRMLRACDEMQVLTLPGWKESTGVTAEIEFCHAIGMKVTFIKPEE